MRNLFQFLFCTILILSCSSEGTETTTNTGVNGSYSGMVIVGDYMYRVDTETLITFDVTDPEDIIELNRQAVGFQIESIFHLEGILFIGSSIALHIFEIDENGIPHRKSQTEYLDFSAEQTVCDPVVSDGVHAFVTLSSALNSNSPCARTVLFNELRIYDITDLTNPIEVNIIDMINPKGLGVDGDLLFVCESEGGLKVFDKSNVLDLQLLHHFEGIHTYDLIARDGLLIVIGQEAIYQFDYSSIDDMELISTLNL